jgi:NAD-dependent dihydropyrimidine dehydrogenase PreA subunit
MKFRRFLAADGGDLRCGAGRKAFGRSSSRRNSELYMAFIIAESCIDVKDTACLNTCPVDCIHPRKDQSDFEPARMLYIDPVACIDCGACVPVCPVEAIYAEDNLPYCWDQFIKINAEHYKK